MKKERLPIPHLSRFGKARTLFYVPKPPVARRRLFAELEDEEEQRERRLRPRTESEDDTRGALAFSPLPSLNSTVSIISETESDDETSSN